MRVEVTAPSPSVSISRRSKFFDCLEKVICRNVFGFVAIGLVFMGIVLILVVMNVVSRRFGYPIAGTHELAGFFMAIAVSASLSYTELNKGHVSVDILGDRLGKKSKMILGIFLFLMTLCLMALLIKGIIDSIVFNWSLGESSYMRKFPIVPIRIFFLYGLVSWCLVVVLNFIKNFMGDIIK